MRKISLFLLVATIPPDDLRAAPGDVDPAFAPSVEAPSVATGIVFEPSGLLVLTGPFESVGGEKRKGIARLLPDGRLDLLFRPEIQFFESQQPGATFWRPNRLFVHLRHPSAVGDNWVLLDNRGRVVEDTLEGLGPGGVIVPAPVRATLARDDTLTVGQGEKIHRYLPDGTRDDLFEVSVGRFGDVARLLPAPEGKTYVVDATTARVSRILADGSDDSAFEIDAPASAMPHTLAVQPDGRLLRVAFTRFSWIDDEFAGEIVRHEAARGEVGRTFPARARGDSERRFLLWRADGTFLLPANYAVGTGIFLDSPGIAAFSPFGFVDEDFNPPENVFAGSPSGAVVMDAAERIVIDGTTRLLRDGQIDAGFRVPGGIWKGGEITQLAKTAGNRLLVTGPMARIDGTDTPPVARLLMDGTLDATFRLDARITGSISRILPLANGGALVTTEDPVEVAPDVMRALVRIAPDGTLDPAFVPMRSDPDADPTFGEALAAEQADGRILVWFADRLTPRFVARRLVRLLPDGSPDPGFTTPGYFSSTVNEITLREDGGILLTGRFRHSVFGVNYLLERLLSDGAPDPEFVRPMRDGTARTHLELDDGRVLVALHDHVLCAERNGEFDDVFVQFGEGTQISDLALETESILAAGDIHLGAGCLPVARVLPNGLIDAAFQPGLMSNIDYAPSLFSLDDQGVHQPGDDPVSVGGVTPLSRDIVLDSSGAIVLGGRFRAIGDTGFTGLAKLEGGAPRNFADWRAAVFRDGLTAETGADRDPNGNGLSNWLEYVLGRDPRSAGAPQPVLDVVPGRVTLAFNPFADDVEIRVEHSDDLSAWEEFPMAEERSGLLVGEFDPDREGYFRLVAEEAVAP